MTLAQFFQSFPKAFLCIEYPCHLSDYFYFVNGGKHYSTGGISDG